jgi:hypothetical protein
VAADVHRLRQAVHVHNSGGSDPADSETIEMEK